MEKDEGIPLYQIETILPRRHGGPGPIAVVKMNSTGVSAKIPVSELLGSKWINKLSNNEVSLLAHVNASGANIENIFGYKSPFPYAIVWMTALFTGLLLASNLIGDNLTKITLPLYEGMAIFVPTAMIVFPLTYGFGACVTETYGFVVSRNVIWSAFLVNAFIVAIVLFLVSSGQLHGSILGLAEHMPRALFASASGYLAGEFANSIVISRLKVLLRGRALISRFIAANFVGAVFDSVLFGGILFGGRVPNHVLVGLILSQIVIKTAYEAIFSLVFSKIVEWIKRSDGVDYYDYKMYARNSANRESASRVAVKGGDGVNE
uniref:VUT family protein n=1 Tax=Burkholderia arboris TaxID=488730 RepID=UPI003BEED44E